MAANAVRLAPSVLSVEELLRVAAGEPREVAEGAHTVGGAPTRAPPNPALARLHPTPTPPSPTGHTAPEATEYVVGLAAVKPDYGI